jgi:hypothetical protein
MPLAGVSGNKHSVFSRRPASPGRPPERSSSNLAKGAPNSAFREIKRSIADFGKIRSALQFARN